MFPTNYFKIRKTFFDSKTQISGKFQTFQCSYRRELVYSKLRIYKTGVI